MEHETSIELTVPEDYHLERIDKFLVHALELDFSRSYIQKLIKNGDIKVNGDDIRANYKVKLDDSILITVPEPEELALEPEDIPIEIVYEDSSLAVINKQPGLVVHPGPGNWNRTLVNALLFHCRDLSSIGGAIRPGIVHRLDKDTTGLMIIAKNDIAHRNLVAAFAGRTVFKGYTAIVTGRPGKEHDVISKPLARHRKYRHKMTVAEDGKEAITEYTLKRMWNTGTQLFSLLDIKIHTGRTHQIRVHLSSESMPIVGDPIYSKKWERHRVPYLLLASTSLSLTHPETGEQLNFSIDLPEHMKAFVDKLDQQSQ